MAVVLTHVSWSGKRLFFTPVEECGSSMANLVLSVCFFMVCFQTVENHVVYFWLCSTCVMSASKCISLNGFNFLNECLLVFFFKDVARKSSHSMMHFAVKPVQFQALDVFLAILLGTDHSHGLGQSLFAVPQKCTGQRQHKNL